MPPGQTHPLPLLAGPADTRVGQAPAALGVQGGGDSGGSSQPRAHRCALQVRVRSSAELLCVLHLGVSLQMLEGKIPHVNAPELVPLWCRNPRAWHPHGRVVQPATPVLASGWWHWHGAYSPVKKYDLHPGLWTARWEQESSAGSGPSHQTQGRSTAQAPASPATEHGLRLGCEALFRAALLEEAASVRFL